RKPERVREQRVRAPPRHRVECPRDDHEFVELEPLCLVAQALRNVFAGADKCLAPQPIDALQVSRGVVVPGRFVRRNQRLANALLESDPPVLARFEQLPRFFVRVCGQSPDANRGVGTRTLQTWTKVFTIQAQSLLDAL